MSAGFTGKVVALSGGIGGAKLALGLSRVIAHENLTIIANIGDDFEHLGLAISPDIDTLIYTLAGLENPATGWGRRDETWTFMGTLERLRGPVWFKLGDGDLALHVDRTRRLAGGETLTAITATHARALGVAPRILPASDDRVATRVATAEGVLDFQDYFVRRKCAPRVTGISFAGAEKARPSPEVLAALADPELVAVVICPSNPLISIDPILAIPGLREAIRTSPAPVVAVSPIIAGKAVKGPTAKMMGELGREASARAVAEHYRGLIDGFIVDHADAASLVGVDFAIVPAQTLMTSLADRETLARVVLDTARRIIGPARYQGTPRRR